MFFVERTLPGHDLRENPECNSGVYHDISDKLYTLHD